MPRCADRSTAHSDRNACSYADSERPENEPIGVGSASLVAAAMHERRSSGGLLGDDGWGRSPFQFRRERITHVAGCAAVQVPHARPAAPVVGSGTGGVELLHELAAEVCSPDGGWLERRALDCFIGGEAGEPPLVAGEVLVDAALPQLAEADVDLE